MRKLLAVLTFTLLSTSSAFAQLGSLTQDLVFTPVTPCRIFDTRTSQGGTGPISAGGTKDFYAFGLTSYVTQGGGNATNCGIPVSRSAQISAVAVNLVVASPTGPGYITAFPRGEVKPLAATLNYNTGEVVVSNGAILKTAVYSLLPTLSIYSSTQTDVIGDIVGYFSAPEPTALQCIDTAVTTVTINANSYNAVVAPECSTGYIETSLSCTGSTINLALNSSWDGICAGKNNDAVQSVLSAKRKCCRIPGL